METGHSRDAGAIAGFTGRDIRSGASEYTARESSTPTGAFKIISFFTEDNEYSVLAARLQAGLRKFDLDYNLVGIKSEGAWELNCAFKARFVRDQWEASNVPIVWVDADATVEQDPVLFRQLSCDFAIHKWNGWQFASGTVYFGKSEYAKALLDQWVLRCVADPVTWDQTSLHLAWIDISSVMPLRTVWLPRPYTAIFDKDSFGPPVIRHWQASRKVKAEGGTTGKPQFDFSPAFMDEACNAMIRDSATARVNLDADAQSPLPQEFYDELGPIVSHYPSLTEVGCGEGALAAYFAPGNYSGLEENPRLLLRAKARYPQHYFRCFDRKQILPRADTLLFSLAFVGRPPAEIIDTLLQALEQADTIVAVDAWTDHLLSRLQDLSTAGCVVTSTRPMKYRHETVDAALSVIVIKKTVYSRLKRLLRRKQKHRA